MEKLASLCSKSAGFPSFQIDMRPQTLLEQRQPSGRRATGGPRTPSGEPSARGADAEWWEDERWK